MGTPIRGITLTHPWAFCITHAGKDVENRTWRPEKQGGKVGMFLAIHGGAIPTGAKKQEAMGDIGYVGTHILTPSYIHHALSTEQLHRMVEAFKLGEEALFTPGIVAVARLAAVTTDGISPWKADGQYQWELADVVALAEPVPHKGHQGLWEIEPEALDLVRERWAAAKISPAAPVVSEGQAEVSTPALTGQVCGTCANGLPTEYPNEVECQLGWERHDKQPKGYNQKTKKADVPVHLGHGSLALPILTPNHRCVTDTWLPR
jgi:hypothetical protein